MPETLNTHLFYRAKRHMPGGVNSPVRSFKAVGGFPIFIKSAKGAKIYSEGKKEFIDYCLSWGALILGHAHPGIVKTITETAKKGTSFGAATKSEIELAERIVKAMPSLEKIRFTNSGTEAVMGAIRLARAYTGRDKVIRFEGAYHGHADYLLNCLGIPRGFARDTLACPYNDAKKVEEVARRRGKNIAAIIVEPVAANMGVILPRDGFLHELKRIADKYNIALIFDEVITGFRLSYGGAQKLFNIKPDLTCLGKIIGGGLPIGAFGGRKEIMRLLAPEGEVYQAGTFSGNPLCVNAGLTALKMLSQEDIYKRLGGLTRSLCEGINQGAMGRSFKIKINSVGSMFTIFFSDKEVVDYNTAIAQDTALFKKFYHGLLKEGIYLSPSGLETNFLSTAHTIADIEITLKAADKTFQNLQALT